MDVKGWSQLLDTVLLEHMTLMLRVQEFERCGIDATNLHWCGWWMLQCGRYIDGVIIRYLDGTEDLDNNMFYKVAAIIEDCKNKGRRGS